MIIGVPKEIKNHEYRVGMVPASVRELTARNHTVFVQSGAGNGIGFSDADYLAAGAEILASAADVFAKAEMIVKVKEPQAVERAMLRPDQTLFTYLHLAPDLAQTRELVDSGAVCIAYETVTDGRGGLPLLAPMSEVAGRMSIQAGAQALEKSRGGSGVLLGGVPGSNAARMAIGLRADVTILDNNIDTLRRLDSEFQGAAKVVYSNRETLERHLLAADLVIGGVLVPGATAPKLVSRDHIARMKPGSAIVDVAIDQGGCVETSHATTHEDPTFIVDEVVHYCVANMPGAVARTSTVALNNATLPFIIKLAEQGYRGALLSDPHLLHGLNVMAGKITCKEVAVAHNLAYTDPLTLLN